MDKGRRVIVASDVDMSESGVDFDGVALVDPDVWAVSGAMRATLTMVAPTVRNLTALREVTWQWLGCECTR